MNVLITGISRGVGLAIAETFLKNGDTVFGISRNLNEQLNLLIEKYQNQLFWLQYDLKDYKDIKQRVFQQFIGNHAIHAFVNNAAVAYDDLITNLNDEALISMYSVNVFTPMIIVKYVIRNMLLHNTKGSIVHISSISAHTGYKGLAMYASTKGALEAFSKNTAREWGEKGIRSNCIVAGFMETEMSSTLTEEQRNRIFQRTSLKKPVDIYSIAETVKFLASESSCSVTGQNVFVDNGTI
jgi:3-oxoacyl-[acyl-carrier protein] reductase